MHQLQVIVDQFLLANRRKTFLFVSIFIALSLASPAIARPHKQTQVGGNRPIQMGRATWDTGWFQTEIYRQLLLEMGYDAPRASTYDVAEFFEA
ncbi:MAG: hypothetical protein AAF629_35265, partial [Chloroflexota bacterium]